MRDTRARLRTLRRRAEHMLRGQPALASALPSSDDPKVLAHELEVHQVELLMQHEELHQAHFELEKRCTRYVELFELAPIAYITMDANGKIFEANEAAAHLLGVDRNVFLRRPLSAFMAVDDANVFHLFRRQVFAGSAARWCELSLRSHSGLLLPVRLDAVAFYDADGRKNRCGCTIVTRSPA